MALTSHFPLFSFLLYAAAVGLALAVPNGRRSLVKRVVLGVAIVVVVHLFEGLAFESTTIVSPFLRILACGGYLLAISAAFVQRPAAAPRTVPVLRPFYVALAFVYLAIAVGFAGHVNWIDFGMRHDRAFRYLSRYSTNLLAFSALVFVSAWSWRRCSRACACLLVGSLLGLVSVLFMAAAYEHPPGRAALQAYGHLCGVVGLTLSLASIFVDRGLSARLLPRLRSHLEVSRHVSVWVSTAVLVAATFLPWINGIATIQRTSSVGGATMHVSQTMEVSCNAWTTTFRLGSLAIPLGLIVVALAVVQVFCVQQRGANPTFRQVARLAPICSASVIVLFLVLLAVSPTAKAGVGILIGLTAVAWQLIPWAYASTLGRTNSWKVCID